MLRQITLSDGRTATIDLPPLTEDQQVQLATGIADYLVRSGMIDPAAVLSGPHMLQFLSEAADLASGAAGTGIPLAVGDQAAVETVVALGPDSVCNDGGDDRRLYGQTIRLAEAGLPIEGLPIALNASQLTALHDGCTIRMTLVRRETSYALVGEPVVEPATTV